MVKIGDKLTFIPSAWAGGDGLGLLNGKTVTGEVDYINYAHRWYRVRYELELFDGRVVCYEAFKSQPEGDERACVLPMDRGHYKHHAPKYQGVEHLPLHVL